MASGKAFEAVVSIAGKIDPSLEKSISKAQKSTSGLGKTIKIAGAVGVAGLTAIGTAAVATVAKSTQAAAEYEKCFAKTATLLSGTQKELDAYSESILKLSNDTGIAASELTETVYSAISAGVDQSQAVGFAGEAAKLAAGGFTDSATAVDVMTTALNAYGLGAEKAGQISDYLITTQNLGKTTVNELASSVGKVIPIASAYGVEMDNLSTAYAQLTAGGIATAEAGTYLKSMLNELGDSGSKVSSILQQETGMGFAELTESGKSLGDVMSILGESVGGDSGAFNELWSSSEAGVGALSLLNAGADSYNDTLNKMQTSAGATDTAYGTMTNTLDHQIETVKNLGKNFMISLGEKMLPTITNAAEKAIPAVSETLDRLLKASETVMPYITKGFESIGPVITKVFESIGPVIENVLQALQQNAKTILPILSGIISAIVPVFQTISSVVMKILPVVFNVIQRIQGVVWGVIEQLLPIVMSFVSRIGGLIEELADQLLPVFEGLASELIPIFEQIAAQLIPFIEEVIVTLEPVIEMIISNLVPVLKIVMQVVGQNMKIIFSALSQIMPVIMEVIQIVLNLCSELLSQLLPILQQIFTAITPIINAAMNIISAILPVVISILKALMPILQFLANVIGVVLGGAIKTVTGYWNFIIQVVQKAMSVFQGILTFLQGFVETWNGIWSGVSEAVSGAFQGLVGIVKGPINTIIGMVNGVIDKINGAGFEIPDWVPVVGGKAFKVSVPTLPMLATGGHTQGPSIAGEEGQETVISYDPRYRDKNIGYWRQAGEMLGIDMANTEENGILPKILGILSKLKDIRIPEATQVEQKIVNTIEMPVVKQDTPVQMRETIGIDVENTDDTGILEKAIEMFSKIKDIRIPELKPGNPMAINEIAALSSETGRALAKDDTYASILETASTSNSYGYTIESIQFNPTIIIQGSADKKDVNDAIEESKEEFFDKLDEWWDEKTGGGDYEPAFG